MTRDEMIADRIPQVQYLAGQLWRKIGCRKDLELDDLISAGYVGLVAAVDRYDGSTKLTTFVRHRVRGAMIDYLRQIDPLSRKHREEVKGTAMEPRHLDASELAIQEEAREQERVIALTTLAHLLDTLSDRERFVIENERRGRVDIAADLGVDVNAVLTIRKKAIAKMRQEAFSRQMGLFAGEGYLHSFEVMEVAA